MSKIFEDLYRSMTLEYDDRSDYRFPERLNGKSLEEIRNFATDYISSMHNVVVFFAEKPYGQGAAYFYNLEDPNSVNEVVYSSSSLLKLNAAEIGKYLDKEKKMHKLRPFIYIGENGVFSQVPARRLKRLANDGIQADTYEDGKTDKDLLAEGYYNEISDEQEVLQENTEAD